MAELRLYLAARALLHVNEGKTPAEIADLFANLGLARQVRDGLAKPLVDMRAIEGIAERWPHSRDRGLSLASRCSLTSSSRRPRQAESELEVVYRTLAGQIAHIDVSPQFLEFSGNKFERGKEQLWCGHWPGNECLIVDDGHWILFDMTTCQPGSFDAVQCESENREIAPLEAAAWLKSNEFDLPDLLKGRRLEPSVAAGQGRHNGTSAHRAIRRHRAHGMSRHRRRASLGLASWPDAAGKPNMPWLTSNPGPINGRPNRRHPSTPRELARRHPPEDLPARTRRTDFLELINGRTEVDFEEIADKVRRIAVSDDAIERTINQARKAIKGRLSINLSVTNRTVYIGSERSHATGDARVET